MPTVVIGSDLVYVNGLHCEPTPRATLLREGVIHHSVVVGIHSWRSIPWLPSSRRNSYSDPPPHTTLLLVSRRGAQVHVRASSTHMQVTQSAAAEHDISNYHGTACPGCQFNRWRTAVVVGCGVEYQRAAALQ